MRFAIVGAGVIGTVHARLIGDLGGRAILVAVVDHDRDKASALAAPHGAAAMGNLDEALARDDIDAVSICLPSGLHADAAVRALEAGKHVIVEKPLEVTLEAADRVIEAERRTGRTVAVISQRRFQPAQRFVHHAVCSGALGRITSGIAESTFWRGQDYYDSGAWRGTLAMDGGGALMNQGIHAADLLVWMLGEPVEVTAFADVLAHAAIEVEDTVAATVRFASGALGTITATTAACPGRSVRLMVNGDRGIALVDDDRLHYFETSEPERDAAMLGEHLPDTKDGGHMDVDAAHRAQYEDFLDAVAEGRPPLVTTTDGRRVLALVLSVYASARSGGAPVRIPSARVMR